MTKGHWLRAGGPFCVDSMAPPVTGCARSSIVPRREEISVPSRLTSPQESASRKDIDGILNNLGWKTDESSWDCQVFTERAKTTEQKTLLSGKFPDYLRYEMHTDRPLAVIEAKRPGQTLKAALDDAIGKYAEPLGINIIFVTDGVLYETFDRRSNGPLHLDSEPITSLLTYRMLLRFANDGPHLETQSSSRQTRHQLIEIFGNANALLRKDGLRAGIERFAEFSNLLFLKLISEIENDREARGENRRLDSRYCWDAFANKDGQGMLDYIQDTILPRLIGQYNHSGDVFQPELQIRTPSTLKDIVSELSKLSLLNVDSDIKGDAFEYFLKHSVTVGMILVNTSPHVISSN